MDRREQKDGINEATFVTIKKRKAAKNPNAAEGKGEESGLGWKRFWKWKLAFIS